MRKMKFGTKIFIAFALLTIIPIIIMVTLFNNEVIKVLSANAEKDTLNLLKKSNDIIDLRFTEIENETSLVAMDQDIFDIFSKELPSSQYELSLINGEVRRVLNSYFSKYDFVYSTFLITTKMPFGQNNNMFIPLENFYRSDVFDIAQQTGGSVTWIPTRDFCEVFDSEIYENADLDYRYIFFEVCTINSMYIDSSLDQGSKKVKNVNENIEKPILLVVIKEDFLKSAFESMGAFEGANYYYMSKQGQVISSLHSDEIGTIKDGEWTDCFTDSSSGTVYRNIDGKKYLVCYDTIETTGWLSTIVIPYESLLKTLPNSDVLIIYITMLIILLFIVLAFYGSRKMEEPIKKMLIVMDAMSQGNFKSRLVVKTQDEIGTLFTYFNSISEKIEKLIEENYLVKIQEKEEHIRALTTQLNPHFITNTLNTINWMAIENDQEAISKMLISLSNMMDYIIRNKKELVELGVELKSLENYIYIMSNKYEGMFRVEYDIDETLLNTYVPKLFLQPIVENVFIHGFEDMTHSGVIRISAKAQDNQRIFSVEDNGKGMSEEQIAKILNTNNQSMGIRNVNERIKLLYGHPYGIRIKSIRMCKTVVTIALPLASR